jgi:hypothetical protein
MRKGEQVPTDPERLLKFTRQLIKAARFCHNRACINRNFRRADFWNARLKYLHSVESQLKRRIPKVQLAKTDQASIIKTDKIPAYFVSTLLLADIYRYLNDGSRTEKMCYVTGVMHGNARVPTQMLAPQMSVRTGVAVRADNASIQQHLRFLDNAGHTILLQCHIHPWAGSGATLHSSIDKANHRDLETWWPVIGLIYSADGYFRFFSIHKRFSVEIYGKGVKKVDEDTFCFG